MPIYTSCFTTMEQVENELNRADPGTAPTDAPDEYTTFIAWLTDNIPAISDWWQHKTGRTFVPYLHTDQWFPYHDRYMTRFRDSHLWLMDDLLEIDTITYFDTELTSSQYRAYHYQDTGILPYNNIDFNLYSVGIGAFNFLWGFNDSIDVEGWWGYNTNPSPYTTIETATITISATSLTVADASLYETFDYIRMEDELMKITARNETTDVLTVERAVNGTTAAAHTTVSVQKWNIQADLKHTITRHVAWAYDNRSNFGSLQFSDGSAVIQSQPTYVQTALTNFPARIRPA